jgi:hypothetical protein
MTLKLIVHEIRTQKPSYLPRSPDRICALDLNISYVISWVRVTVFLSDAGCLFMPGRHFVQTAEDPKFSGWDWIADARCSHGSDVVHITGASIPLLFTDTKANLPYS